MITLRLGRSKPDMNNFGCEESLPPRGPQLIQWLEPDVPGYSALPEEATLAEPLPSEVQGKLRETTDTRIPRSKLNFEKIILHFAGHESLSENIFIFLSALSTTVRASNSKLQ